MKLTLTSAALAIIAVIFEDLWVFSLAAIPVCLLTYEVISIWKVKKNLSKLIEVKPKTIDVKINAGKTVAYKLDVKSLTSLEARFEPKRTDGLEVEVDPDEVGKGLAEKKIRFRATLAGEYLYTSLIVRIKGKLGLIEGLGSLTTKMHVKVYPRVLAAAIETASFLLSGGGLGYGEQPSPYRGAGLEYAESRVYVPGDTIRHMDWKATARLGRLIVKDYYIEGGLGIHVIYEASAQDPISRDELSTAFLNTVLAIARQSIPIGITIHDGKEIWLNLKNVDSKLALVYALRYALKSVDVTHEELYTLLEPKTATQLRRILHILDRDELKKIVELEINSIKELIDEPYKVIFKMMEDVEERFQPIIITSLTGNPTLILELNEKTKRKGSNLLMLQPTKPWLHTVKLEEAYRLYRHYAKISSILEKHGVKMTPHLNKLLEYTLAYTPKISIR